MTEREQADQYIQVIIDRVSDAVDRPFQYRMPRGLCAAPQVGMQVRVPFRSGKINAFVVGVQREPDVQDTKDVLCVLEHEPALSPEMIALSYWLSRRFFLRWSEAIHLCLPPARNKVKKKFVERVFPAVDQETLREEASRIKPRASRQALILEFLAAAHEGLDWPGLRQKTGADRRSLLALQEKGLLEIRSHSAERNPWAWDLGGTKHEAGLRLTEEQQRALEKIEQALDHPSQDILLHGITGSGKTELYFLAMERVLRQGKQAILLVPEIALTPHMITLLRERFPGQVGMLHSGLTPGERFDQWWKIKERKVNIVLGSRSAIFAPLDALGLIVMDEEHENTYRQDDSPRYHARDVARWRARHHGALLLLGSATPSLETYAESLRGTVKMLKLRERVPGRFLPSVEVVDMRQEFGARRRSVLSRRLYESVKQTLAAGEQVILFLNRRGFAGVELCRRCGFVVECPHCSVSLTYHSFPEHLQCHYCTFKREPYRECPRCRSLSIGNFGLGTQKLEKQVKEAFPQAGVIRLDSDVTSARGVHEKVWRTFKENQASILIGTQMIAKGHDFPGVTLVGVIAADINLHLPDFRAGEKTFQLLTQVSGRAGRGEKRGKVIVQTFSPEHYSIRAALDQDYSQFIREEARRRRLLHYPPYTDLLIFGCSARQEEKALAAAEELSLQLAGTLAEGEALLGPSPAPIKRVNGFYRYHVLYKGDHLQAKNQLLRETIWNYRRGLTGEVRVTVDFNPLMML